MAMLAGSRAAERVCHRSRLVCLVRHRRSIRRDTAGSRWCAGRADRQRRARTDVFPAFECQSTATWHCIDEHSESTDGKEKYLQEKDWDVVKENGGAENDKGGASRGWTITKAAMPGTTCPLWTGHPDSCICVLRLEMLGLHYRTLFKLMLDFDLLDIQSP